MHARGGASRGCVSAQHSVAIICLGTYGPSLPRLVLAGSRTLSYVFLLRALTAGYDVTRINRYRSYLLVRKKVTSIGERDQERLQARSETRSGGRPGGKQGRITGCSLLTTPSTDQIVKIAPYVSKAVRAASLLVVTLLILLYVSATYVRSVFFRPVSVHIQTVPNSGADALASVPIKKPAVLQVEDIDMAAALKHLKIAPKEAHQSTVIFLHVRRSVSHHPNDSC